MPFIRSVSVAALAGRCHDRELEALHAAMAVKPANYSPAFRRAVAAERERRAASRARAAAAKPASWPELVGRPVSPEFLGALPARQGQDY